MNLSELPLTCPLFGRTIPINSANEIISFLIPWLLRAPLLALVRGLLHGNDTLEAQVPDAASPIKYRLDRKRFC